MAKHISPLIILALLLFGYWDGVCETVLKHTRTGNYANEVAANPSTTDEDVLRFADTLKRMLSEKRPYSAIRSYIDSEAVLTAASAASSAFTGEKAETPGTNGRGTAYSDGLYLIKSAEAGYFTDIARDYGGNAPPTELTHAGKTLLSRTDATIRLVGKALNKRIPTPGQVRAAYWVVPDNGSVKNTSTGGSTSKILPVRKDCNEGVKEYPLNDRGVRSFTCALQCLLGKEKSFYDMVLYIAAVTFYDAGTGAGTATNPALVTGNGPYSIEKKSCNNAYMDGQYLIWSAWKRYNKATSRVKPADEFTEAGARLYSEVMSTFWLVGRVLNEHIPTPNEVEAAYVESPYKYRLIYRALYIRPVSRLSRIHLWRKLVNTDKN